MTRSSIHRPLVVVPAVIAALLGCGKLKSLTGGGSAADAGSDGSTVATEESRPTDKNAVCTSAGHKSWGKWTNQRTGLTARNIGGKLGVGVAIGNRPHVLLFDKDGSGELVKVPLADGSELGKDIAAKDGTRVLERVTPVTGPDGRISAYTDYRDVYQTKHRRVACELAATRHALLVFDDKPLLERDDAKDAGAPAATPDASVNPKIIAAAAGAARRLHTPGLKAVAAAATAPDAGAPVAAQPTTVQKEDKGEKKKPLREIRDCRSFVDPDGYVWAVGSELYGEPQSDDSVKWSMRFFVSPNAGGGYYLLASEALGKDPKELPTFEAPTSGVLADGSIGVAARYRGSLMLWALSKEHKPSGHEKSYRGGFPTMAELFPDGDGLLLLTSQKGADNKYELRYAHVGSSGLPGALDKPALEGSDSSLSEPTFANAGGQRWLGYQAGTRRAGQLSVVPVNESLKAVGRPYDVNAEGRSVAESHVFPLEGGKLLVVYIESVKDGDELVSEVLTCSVKT